MHDDYFSQLLSGFMRRIRASASGVAVEIGMSREAVNNWRTGASRPSPRHRHKLLDCARYLRLSEHETDRLLTAAGFDAEYPAQLDAASEPYARIVTGLLDRLDALSPCAILMLLSQAHWGQPPCREELLRQARERYGAGAMLHLCPPYSTSHDPAACFAALGRQCGRDAIDSEFAFEAALEQRLRTGEQLFCLVSRFEQSEPALREALAGILRSLCEMHGSQVRLLLCGGESLADLRYQGGDLSLLNIASVEHWPEIGLGDLRLLAARRQPASALDEPTLARALRLCGGHPVLAERVIDELSATPTLDDAELEARLALDPRLWQAFVPLMQSASNRERIEAWLGQSLLAPARPYLLDPLLRQLYWANLIVAGQHGARQPAALQWRCPAVRRAGLEIAEQCRAAC